MLGLAMAGGIAVGFALGLTGGGGGIFAVPLLVYGLSMPVREAVGTSLAAVGATALVGTIQRRRRGETDARVGLLFAIAGMIGAPMGSRLSRMFSESVLLLMFGGLMIVVAVRMWQNTGRKAAAAEDRARSACQLDEQGRLALGTRCMLVLAVLGLTTGVISGMFGVGGGFIIVPALVLVGRLPIHTAVATSLMVIFLISLSGVASYISGGGTISWELTSLFAVGGIVGMYLGSQLSARLSGPSLQRIFAVAVVVVACFIVVKSMA